jgi:protoheme IX farnesyltransferase
MITGQIEQLSGPTLFLAKARACWELLKFRLSFLVAFSCAFGYSLASNNINWYTLSMVFIGGLLMSGASIVVNQIIERDLDKLMARTLSRPLPTQRLSVFEAAVFGIFCFAVATIVLWVYTNPLTVGLSIVSMILYSFVYSWCASSVVRLDCRYR